MSGIVMAIDQGTTGTTVLLFNQELKVLGKVNEEFPQIYPKPGWAEHDPEEIWKCTQKAIAKVFDVSGLTGEDVKAIGITNQRETTLIWEKSTGKPIHNAVVWLCRRTADDCEALKKEGFEPEIREKTGLILDPYFSGTKIRWLLKNVQGARSAAERGELSFGTIDTYILRRLTGGVEHATDVTNASRTLLFNINDAKWDDRLLEILDVPRSLLPSVHPSSHIFGETRGVEGLPDGIPIAGIAGDQQAALFGQACFEAGQAKCTYGTGAFLVMNVGDTPVISNSGLLGTVAWGLGDKITYALEGSVFIAGAAVQWIRDGLEFIERADEIEALAAEVDDTGGVLFVPALSGLGAPHWRPEARGLIKGLTRGTRRGHIARATLEGIALSANDLLAAMQKDSGKDLAGLRVDGGASANNLLMQMQADISNTNLKRPAMLETTSLGAALLAGLATSIWKSKEEIAEKWSAEREFFPCEERGWVEEKIKMWKRAVSEA